MILSIILFLVFLAAFYFLGIDVVGQWETTIDSYSYKLFAQIKSPIVTRLMIWITFFGSRYFMIPAYTALVTYCLLYLRKIKLGVVIAALAATGNCILYLMQQLFHRERPADPLIENVTGYGFPSGHAFAAYTFFGLLIFLVWRSILSKRQKIFLSFLFFLAATTIAATRIYLHVHYATDMLGGFCLSMAWLTFSFWILHWIDRKSL